MSNDEDFTGTFAFSDGPISPVSLGEDSPNEYISCYYDNNWCIGLIQEIDEEERNVKISFIYPPGTSRCFTWPG